jgi:hypothetical protein
VGRESGVKSSDILYIFWILVEVEVCVPGPLAECYELPIPCDDDGTTV